MVWGAIIGAGASLLGSKMASKDSERVGDQTVEANKQTLKESQRQFNILQNKQIQNRVADARSAGIHPLYALGTAPGSPVPFMASGPPAGGGAAAAGVAEAGRILGKGVDKYQARGIAKELHDAQVRATNAAASRDEAAAALTNSRTAMVGQQVNTSQDGEFMTGNVLTEPAVVPAGKIKSMPAEVISATKGKPHLQAGVKPGLSRYNFGDGKVFNLVASEDPSEALENMPAVIVAALDRQNQKTAWNLYKNWYVRMFKKTPHYHIYQKLRGAVKGKRNYSRGIK